MCWLEINVHTEIEETRYGVNTAVDTVVADLGIDARITGDRAYVVDAHVDAQRTVLHPDEAADALGQRVTQRDVLQAQVVAVFEEYVGEFAVVTVRIAARNQAQAGVFAALGVEVPAVEYVGNEVAVVVAAVHGHLLETVVDLVAGHALEEEAEVEAFPVERASEREGVLGGVGTCEGLVIVVDHAVVVGG